MATLEDALKTIVEVFEQFAGEDGKLSKDEMKKLLESQMQDPEIKAKICEAGCKKAMRKRDRDCEGGINFQMFSRCVARVLNCYYKKKSGKGLDCDDDDDDE